MHTIYEPYICTLKFDSLIKMALLAVKLLNYKVITNVNEGINIYMN
jgi:hypothetical protein